MPCEGSLYVEFFIFLRNVKKAFHISPYNPENLKMQGIRYILCGGSL